MLLVHGLAKRKSCEVYKSKKEAKIRNRYNYVQHLTQDTIWENDKDTRKHHIHESQEVNLFSAGGHKAATNRQNSITKTNTKHK